MERPNEPTLLGILAETRNQILELVCYHEEFNGIISPKRWVTRSSFVVSIGEKRISFNNDTNVFIRPTGSGSWKDCKDQVNEMETAWRKSPCSAANHFCTPFCLVQPPVTRVSRQLRKEALTIFYGINKIHLELANFELFQNGHKDYLGTSPCAWWRAIGNATLDSIKQLSLAIRIHPGYNKVEPDLLITYAKNLSGTGVKDILRTTSKDVGDLGRNMGVWEKQKRIQPQLETLREEGLRVETIEEIVKWFERYPQCFLWDRDTLNLDSKSEFKSSEDDSSDDSEDDSEEH